MKQVRVARTQQRAYDKRRSIRTFGDNAVRKHREEYEQRKVRETAYQICIADATEIISIRRCNCRWCWSANYEYQRTDWEIECDLNRFLAANGTGVGFNQMGGGGYAKSRDPNPECPICLGNGEELARITDFRKLSARGRNLIAGIKLGKGGHVEEIRFHDKIAAINTFAKIDGMITQKKVIREVEPSERDLDDYFAQNAASIDHGDAGFASFVEKVTQTTDKE